MPYQEERIYYILSSTVITIIMKKVWSESMDKALILDDKGNRGICEGDSWLNRIYNLIRNKKYY